MSLNELDSTAIFNRREAEWIFKIMWLRGGDIGQQGHRHGITWGTLMIQASDLEPTPAEMISPASSF